jgi:hypothetical protein
MAAFIVMNKMAIHRMHRKQNLFIPPLLSSPPPEFFSHPPPPARYRAEAQNLLHQNGNN